MSEGEHDSPGHGSGPGGDLYAQLEKVTKLSGVLAVGGYISLKSHLNLLGVPLGSGVDSERYLFEIWYLFSTVVLRLAFYAVPIGVLLLMLHAALLRWGGLGKAWRGLAARLQHWLPGAWLPGLLCWLLLLAIVFLELRAPPYGLLLGDKLRAGTGLPDSQLFDIAMLGWVLAAWVIRVLAPLPVTAPPASPRLLVGVEPPESPAHPPEPSKLWLGCQVLLGAFGLLNLVLFGACVHSRDYSLVVIKQGAEHPTVIKGMLILESGHELRLLVVDSGGGRVLAVPREHAEITYLERRDIVSWAREELDRPAATDSQAGGAP